MGELPPPQPYERPVNIHRRRATGIVILFVLAFIVLKAIENQ